MTEVSWFSVPWFAVEQIRPLDTNNRGLRQVSANISSACPPSSRVSPICHSAKPYGQGARRDWLRSNRYSVVSLLTARAKKKPPSDEGGGTKWRREREAKCSYISCKQEVILPSAVILASPVILLTMFAVKDEIALRWNLHYVQMKSLCDEILLRRVMLVGRWACSRRKKPQCRAWRPRHAVKKPQSDGGNTWGRGTYSRLVRTRFECTKQKNHQKT